MMQNTIFHKIFVAYKFENNTDVETEQNYVNFVYINDLALNI